MPHSLHKHNINKKQDCTTDLSDHWENAYHSNKAWNVLCTKAHHLPEIEQK